MPRFTVLDHDFPARHWDFLLEAGDLLRAWRLLAEPGQGYTVQAVQLPDHRFVYLDYEGPVSGDRGTVVRWDTGTFEWVRDGECEVVVDVSGTRLRGRAVIERTPTGWTWHLVEADS